MFRQKRMVRRLVVVGLLALLLVGVVGVAAAQGPGGRGGNGRGNGGANGSSGSGLGQNQRLQDGSELGSQSGYGSQSGNSTQPGLGQNQRLQDGSELGSQSGYGTQSGLGSQSGYGSQNGNGNGQQLGAGLGLNNCDGSCLALTLPAATPGELPSDVIAALNAGLQDEYNAYAIYQTVIDQFGVVRPFTTIQQSEAHHIELLTFLFDRYGLTVPAAQSTASAPTFATLADACAAGAAAEIANFDLYDSWIATVQAYPDMVEVFTQLRDASEFQHLPAFERCAG